MIRNLPSAQFTSSIVLSLIVLLSGCTVTDFPNNSDPIQTSHINCQYVPQPKQTYDDSLVQDYTTIQNVRSEEQPSTFYYPKVLSASDQCWPNCPQVWGIAGLRGFFNGSEIAPNGVEFNPLFFLSLDFNFWLWKEEKLYVFADSRFWGQKPAPGITNPNQGVFDFSKREFDLDIGFAWNYYKQFELRSFAYSLGNLNRGNSDVQPSGYIDGVGIENRWYVGGSYTELGQPGFDVSRATFVSLGFCPTNEMLDVEGNVFRPGPFARAYFCYDLTQEAFLYIDLKAIGNHSFTPTLLGFDQGIAYRPLSNSPNFQVRVGADGKSDFQFHNVEINIYASLNFVF